jgi:hypothetical protein
MGKYKMDRKQKQKCAEKKVIAGDNHARGCMAEVTKTLWNH